MNRSKKLTVTVFCAMAGIFGSALGAQASPLTDGYNAYHAHDYVSAAADFQQAATATGGADAAKAYYMDGLALHHQGKNSDAVAAYDKAKTADPSLSFASSAQDFNHNYLIAQKDSGSLSAGTSTYVPSGAGGTAPTTDQAAYALTTADEYVAPDFHGNIDKVQLTADASDDDAPVKIAVLDHLPAGYHTPTAYAKALNDYLHAHQPYGVIVVAVNGTGRGIADWSDQMSQTQEKNLAEKYVAQIGTGDYNGGLKAMSGDMRSIILDDYHRPMTILSEIVLAIIIIVAIVVIARSSRKKATVASLKGSQQAALQSVVDGISHLDEYIDVLPKNNADTDQVKAFRQAAAYKLDQAEKILARSTEVSDVSRAQGILQQALGDVHNGTQYLNRVTGGASTAAEPTKAVPFPTSQAQVNQVPQEQRGVSFFSSQPAPVSQLTPVKLNVDGQEKTVMATQQEAAMVQRGQIPPVRSFNVGGQSVPWYAYQSYDPYDDYWTYQNNGWRGVAGGAIAGFIGAEIIDSLFAPRPYWGGGWNSPYAYGPGWDTWGGWNDYGYGGGGYNTGYDQGFIRGENMGQAQNYAMQDQYTAPPQDSNASGASFMGNSPGYDTSDYNNSSGASFMGNDHS